MPFLLQEMVPQLVHDIVLIYDFDQLLDLEYPFAAVCEVLDGDVLFGLEVVPLVELFRRNVPLNHVGLAFELLDIFDVVVLHDTFAKQLYVPNFVDFIRKFDIFLDVVYGAGVNLDKVFPHFSEITIRIVLLLFFGIGRRWQFCRSFGFVNLWRLRLYYHVILFDFFIFFRRFSILNDGQALVPLNRGPKRLEGFRCALPVFTQVPMALAAVDHLFFLLLMGFRLYSRGPGQMHVYKCDFFFFDGLFCVEDNFGRLLVSECQRTFGVHVFDGNLMRVDVSMDMHELSAYVVVIISFDDRVVLHLEDLLVDDVDFISLLLITRPLLWLDHRRIVVVDLVMSLGSRGVVVQRLSFLLLIEVIIRLHRQLLLGGPLLPPRISRKIITCFGPLLGDDENVALSLLVALSQESGLSVFGALNLIELL